MQRSGLTFLGLNEKKIVFSVPVHFKLLLYYCISISGLSFVGSQSSDADECHEYTIGVYFYNKMLQHQRMDYGFFF
jgi:hypothetical protein